MTTAFNPDRLELARQRRGKTKRGLAEAVGITPAALQRYYTYHRTPDQEIVELFANELDFPLEFFYQETAEFPPADGMNYRALSRATSRHRMQANAIGALGMLLSDWIVESYDLETESIPEHSIDSPELAAEAVRAEWGIGELSITNVVSLLETHGVRIFSLATDTPELDAFSFWRGDTPFMFLNTDKSPERTRMDAAHELGHLVMHRYGSASGSRQAENEATAFASAFLMPQSSVYANIGYSYNLSIDQLIEKKKLWKVSLTSLIVRLNRLDLITGHRYRVLMSEAAEKGYRAEEPFKCKPDLSAVLDFVFNPLVEIATDIRTTAEQLSLYVDELYELLRGLVKFPMLVPDRIASGTRA